MKTYPHVMTMSRTQAELYRAEAWKSRCKTWDSRNKALRMAYRLLKRLAFWSMMGGFVWSVTHSGVYCFVGKMV